MSELFIKNLGNVSRTMTGGGMKKHASRWGRFARGYAKLRVQGLSLTRLPRRVSILYVAFTMTQSSTSSAKRNVSRSSSNLNGREPPSAALEAVGVRPRRAQRRPTTQASYALTNHAKAYLEGDQCTCHMLWYCIRIELILHVVASGYDFLYSLLAAGTSISTPAQPHMSLLAPPAYLALASSLIADPLFTTRAQSNDALLGSDAALRYLQCVHTTIDDPASATIRKAFAFPVERNRRRTLATRSARGSLSPGQRGDIEQIAGKAANELSLWYCADDFWHIVGWAFNCSVRHKKRWGRWKLWLKIMIDFLEADWEVCVKQSKSSDDQVATLCNSLLWRYIVGDADTTSTTRVLRRRIVKATLATATPESFKDYPEVWQCETSKPKRKRKRDLPLNVVNFETGELGDYDSDKDMQDATDESDGLDDQQEPPNDLKDRRIRNVHDAAECFGGQDALELRQRFIALVSPDPYP